MGALAGRTNQPTQSIVIDASGSGLIPSGTGRFHVKPVRGVAAAGAAMYYDPTTAEITYTTSSATTKNTINDLDMNTGVIEQLQPKTYLYNSDPDAGMQIGYIAEQVSDIHHHFALYGGDGKL